MNRKQRRATKKQGRPVTEHIFADALRCHQDGLLSEAERLYCRVLAVDPHHADSLHLLGVIAHQSERNDLAVELIGKAIALDNRVASYHSNLGIVLKSLGRPSDAIACHGRALELQPDFPEALNNLGLPLEELGRVDEAIVCYRRALALTPDFPEAHCNLGHALQQQWHLDEAAASCRRAIALRPCFPEAYVHLGIALKAQARLDEAATCFRKALDLKPDQPEAHNNLGHILLAEGQLDGAIACYRRSLALKPELADVHHHLAMALLTQGDFVAGWEEYEWRWKTQQFAQARRNFAQPQWRGETAEGRTLLLHAEQGFGDTLQFCRYGPLAAASGLRVIVEAPQPLVRLLRSLSGIDQVVQRGETLPAFDFHCPMLSMPLAFGTTVATVPRAVSYLHADEAQVAAWETRLAAMAIQGPRIGLVWAGNSRIHSPYLAVMDSRRSLDPERLVSLLELPGLNFFSLQKAGSEMPVGFRLINVMEEVEDFADTAALIANLDLVISVDTAVAHLAGALGKPVWLLDRFDPCWRWLRGRRDSPWYPTLRIYRQPSPGDWDSVLADIACRLQALKC